MQLQFTTSPTFGDPRLPIRFWNKVRVVTNGCWLWEGVLSHGYGQFYQGGRMREAHRIAYERLISTVPTKFDCHHLCPNRACTNPTHIKALSHREHSLLTTRQIIRCPYGHLYTVLNTYVNQRGGRECRVCRKRKGRRGRI